MNSNSQNSETINSTNLSPSAAMAARLIESNTLPQEVHRFLAKPLSSSAKQRLPIAQADSGPHVQLMELIAPLTRSNLIESHQAADLAEPIAAGIGEVLRHLAQSNHRQHSQLQKQIALTSLMPVYLAVGQNKVDDSLMQTLTLLRDYICLQQMNETLGEDLTVYLANQVSANYTPRQTLHDSLSIDLRETALRFFTKTIADESTSGGLVELDDKYTSQLWNLAAQWGVGNGVVTVDASLSLKRVDWNRLQIHWIDLWQTIESSNHSPADQQEPRNLTVGDIGHANATDLANSPDDSESAKLGRRDSAQHPHRRGAIGQQSAASRDIAKGLDQCELLLNSLDDSQSNIPGLDSLPDDRREPLPLETSIIDAGSKTNCPNARAEKGQTKNDGKASASSDPHGKHPSSAISTNTSSGSPNNIGHDKETTSNPNEQQVARDSQTAPDVQQCIEIRRANDPNLIDNLRLSLQQCRDRSGAISIVIIQATWGADSESGSIADCHLSNWFIALMESIKNDLHVGDIRCFSIDENEFGFVVEEHDRSEVTGLVRDAIENLTISDIAKNSLAANTLPSLACGISFASSPSRTCTIESLMESATRCLKAAARQGNGAIKSIEVY